MRIFRAGSGRPCWNRYGSLGSGSVTVPGESSAESLWLHSQDEDGSGVLPVVLPRFKR